MKYLVIVESPSKARTIEQYLGKDYRVLSSMGHIRDLPAKEMGVDVEKDFEATMVVTNTKQAKALRKEAKNAEIASCLDGVCEELGLIVRPISNMCVFSPPLIITETQIGEYFRGERRGFDLPIELCGTDFQREVWTALRGIDYGTTCSYADTARSIGRAQAVRAVGRANGMNAIAIVVPCHRVVGADGKLTGYGGGLWRKQRLLDLERENAGS